jgi:hypothetical protein
LHVVAAELWRKDRALTYVDKANEQLSTTIVVLKTALVCEQAFAVAELPKSLQMGSNENPAKYLSSKYQNLTLTAATKETLDKLSGLLEKLHDPKLDSKKREANLKLLSASVKEAENKIIGDDRIMLPLVAEATREALGVPRGVRLRGPDKESRAMTEAGKQI